MALQIQSRMFIENNEKSTGLYGKILGIIQLTRDGDESILYAIYNSFTGQCVSRKEAAYIEDFNRYMQAGKLQWR